MIRIEVGSPEWLEARREHITATDMPIIMGVSKWKSVHDLYLEKTGKVVSFKNGAMQRGIDLEPEARKIFENRFATLVDPEFVISKEIPWAAASLDGWDGDSTLIEIKCSGKEDHGKAVEGIIPKHYYPQLQWQMMVTGLNKMFYVSYRPEDVNSFVTIVVERDQDYIKEMVVKAEEFYTLVKNRTPPGGNHDTLSSDDIKTLDDDYSLSLEMELHRLLSKRKEEDERIEYIKQELLKMCKGEKTRGQFLKFTPLESKGAIQYEKIPQLMGVNLEMYRKPSFVKWRIDQIKQDV